MFGHRFLEKWGCCFFLVLSIAVGASGSDRVLNQDLLAMYSNTEKDYLLVRETLLARYRQKNSSISSLFAYHRRFSSLERHEEEIKSQTTSGRLTVTEANQYRLKYFLQRGPLSNAKKLLNSQHLLGAPQDWVWAQKARLFLTMGDYPNMMEALRQVLRTRGSVRYLHPWVFSLPFQMQSWKVLYFLKTEIWPRVLSRLPSGDPDRPFFEFLIRIPLSFPFVPMDFHRLSQAPPLFVALEVLLSIGWIRALYGGDDSEIRRMGRQLEYYYPTMLSFVRYKVLRAKSDRNRQKVHRLMAQLKVHDPVFWKAMRKKDLTKKLLKPQQLLHLVSLPGHRKLR